MKKSIAIILPLLIMSTTPFAQSLRREPPDAVPVYYGYWWTATEYNSIGAYSPYQALNQKPRGS